MDEIGADHGGMMLVPAGHGSGSAHGLVGVEETAAGFCGDALLDGNDLRNGAHGGDGVASGAFAAVHGAHDEDRSVGEGGADAADGANEFGLVLLFDVGWKA